MFCPSTALLRGQRAVRVNLTFELGEKRLASWGRELTRVVTGVRYMGSDAAS
jgi:hypothetical protein